MTRRTLSDAESFVAANADAVSMALAEAWRDEIATARARAQDMGERAHAERYASVAAVADDARASATAVTAELRHLIAQATQGETPSRDVVAAMEAVRGQQRRCRRQLAEVADGVAALQAIEADPVGWVDDRLFGYPLIRPEFTF